MAVMAAFVLAASAPTVASAEAPQCLTTTDPDNTGYPFINVWKGYQNKEVTTFLNYDERQVMTQARVDQSVAFRPVFRLYDNSIRGMLTPLQCTKYEGFVAQQDMERMAMMTPDETNGYVAALSQELHLDADQERMLWHRTYRLLSDIAPIHDQYAQAFDAEIASATARRVAERSSGTWTISVGPK
jgi:hypothetical protein